MRHCSSGRLWSAILLSCLIPAIHAQEAKDAQNAKPAAPTAANTISVEAKLVVVPVIVYDKKGLVTTLTKDSFALSVGGKPQTIRYFDHDADVPLTVGLLVDVSRSQTSVLDEEQKASQTFLESMLAPASGARHADRAFVMQFGRTAELLQDVTDSHPLLEAGLKEIGTQAPGTTDADDQQQGQNGNNGNNGNNNGGTSGSGNPGSNGGYGRGGSGRNGNSGNGNTGGNSHGGGGTVLYDSLFLASSDVVGKQTGRRALIVLTDGVDRHSKESLTEAIEAAQRADTVVYAIYYKGEEPRQNFNPGGQRGGYGGYGGGYPGGGNYPGSGGRPGSDGTYAQPDGKKILQRICGETGGQVFEVKGKGSVEKIYKQIGGELRAQYRLGFSPTEEAASAGYHPIQLTLTGAEGKKLDIQTRDGYYTGAAKAH
ncbi:MAG: VWA domain-containing protein [Janthinobacterium lividum]